ncbi:MULTISPECIES: superoxide dismutase [Micromonospora]|uniref:Superoxide dismutase n=1 Tax=Micromonospora tulbaghiae TaxID=479978 RepID=A0A386WH81_9ACTN|nr:superoxide dismutase [Micromonospora tulbaghiae]AYF26849.1 superoxide dismutase [Micromonospora tulbaghiae]NED56934.1 superoxide dismutase [Micromonospora aurantiaca]
MTGPVSVAADLVQRAGGVIAARRRGDFAGAETLLASFETEQARTLGFYLLADLALGLVRAQTGQSPDELMRELTLLVATTSPPPPD